MGKTAEPSNEGMGDINRSSYISTLLTGQTSILSHGVPLKTSVGRGWRRRGGGDEFQGGLMNHPTAVLQLSNQRASHAVIQTRCHLSPHRYAVIDQRTRHKHSHHIGHYFCSFRGNVSFVLIKPMSPFIMNCSVTYTERERRARKVDLRSQVERWRGPPETTDL